MVIDFAKNTGAAIGHTFLTYSLLRMSKLFYGLNKTIDEANNNVKLQQAIKDGNTNVQFISNPRSFASIPKDDNTIYVLPVLSSGNQQLAWATYHVGNTNISDELPLDQVKFVQDSTTVLTEDSKNAIREIVNRHADAKLRGCESLLNIFSEEINRLRTLGANILSRRAIISSVANIPNFNELAQRLVTYGIKTANNLCVPHKDSHPAVNALSQLAGGLAKRLIPVAKVLSKVAAGVSLGLATQTAHAAVGRLAGAEKIVVGEGELQEKLKSFYEGFPELHLTGEVVGNKVASAASIAWDALWATPGFLANVAYYPVGLAVDKVKTFRLNLYAHYQNTGAWDAFKYALGTTLVDVTCNGKSSIIPPTKIITPKP